MGNRIAWATLRLILSFYLAKGLQPLLSLLGLEADWLLLVLWAFAWVSSFTWMKETIW